MRNILIVGASSKVGLSVVESFLSKGDNVIATYNQNNIVSQPNLTSLLFNSNNYDNIISYINDNRKSLDIIIFLSAVLPGKQLIDYEDDEVDMVMMVNFTAQVKLLKKLLPCLTDNSQILMMSSISGQRGSFDPIYAASKSAILGFVKAMSSSLAPKTRINAIAPGLIENSTMYNEMSVQRHNFHRETIPLKRFLQADDVGKIVVDLTMPHWSHLNGACIDLNGGQYVR